MISNLLGNITITKQTVLLAIVGTVALGGAGLGILGPEFGIGTAPVNTTESTVTATPTATPAPPPVSVTPPETATSGSAEGTASSTTPTGTATPSTSTTPTGTATPSTRTTPTGTQTPDRSGGDDSHTGDSRFADPAVSLSVSDPANVENDAGAVGAIGGEATARATWTGEVDAVVFVLSARRPDGSWTEVARGGVSARADGVTLANAVERDSFTYLDAANASAYDNPTNATVVTRTGSIAVTAVFFDDGQRVGSAHRVRSYSFEVTNTGAVDLAVDGTAARDLSVAEVVPGTTAERRVSVRNRGNASGDLRVALADRTASENGLAEPEVGVDAPRRVELYDALELRVWVAGDDGSNRTYLVGGPDGFVHIREVDRILGSVFLSGDETRHVVLEWRIPRDAGNAIMTDTVGFDLELTLTSDGLV